MNEPTTTRLNKTIALLLGVSRREADEMIEAGRVRIADVTAVLGSRIPEGAILTVDGKRVDIVPDVRYIMLNKPAGYVCSRRAQGDNPTIYELLPPEMAALKPVGRLDKDSSGLILLTNDGDFAHEMTHPKFAKTKLYEVSLDKELQPLHQQMIADYGVEIGDGVSTFGLERQDDSRTAWLVTMREGRNRQIRRTFAALGYDVVRLHRTMFGTFRLSELPEGQFVAVPKAAR